ncbi:MAG TPA: porin [Verrucomicrobiota bacterium]|nr:porin [Verrucomicrobiota bacterium]
MKPDRTRAQDRWFSVGLLATLLFTVGSPGVSHARDATTAKAEPASAQTSSDTTAPADEGPERLKRQVHLTLETNTLAVSDTTTRVVPKEKSSQWKATWEGWDGLHLELTMKTLLGLIVPGDAIDQQLSSAEAVGLPARPTNCYRLRLEEARMSTKIGGKLALDGAAYVTGQEFEDFDAGIEFRRARIYAKGDCLLVLPVSYQVEIGYIPDQFYIEESYLSFKNLPWIGELKAGQYQAPMGLDVITSGRDIAFMEPAAPLQALAPGVNAGLQIGRPVFNQRATWKFGLFTDGVGDDFGEASKDYGRAAIRLTGLPHYQANPEQPEATKLLHLGLSANVLYSAVSSVRYRSRPESHLAPYVIDTGDMAADGALVVGAEAAWVNGPFSVQGEFLHSSVHEDNGQVPGFNGLYASASWFLTGESRPYDRIEGMFGRVVPKRNFDFGHGGWGAWELAARYSFVDLDSADVHGGRLSMLMAGLNWYLHSHVKWRFDYGFGHVSERQPEGNINLFQTRVEIDF